jgi:hypothetical protein
MVNAAPKNRFLIYGFPTQLTPLTQTTGAEAVGFTARIKSPFLPSVKARAWMVEVCLAVPEKRAVTGATV